MKLIICVVASTLLFAACAGNETIQENAVQETIAKNRLDEVNWMNGSWEMQTPDGEASFIEQWEKTNDSVLSGKGMMVNKKGDTVFSEQLQLVKENDVLWYIPTIASQNAGQPVRFREKSITKSEVVFENPEHDFPQRIIYQRKGQDGMYARIEGMQNNSLRKEEFSFKRKAKKAN